MIKMLDLHKQYISIKEDIDQAIVNVVEKNAFIGGEYLEQFEEEFCQYQEVEYCVGVGNGTDGLEIALEALGLELGSEVVVPANTFIASSEAVTRSGHKVVFCDCDPGNYTISLGSLESKITSKTRAIVAVHLYGHPCDMHGVLQIARRHDLRVVEDCAQAHGARYRGRRVGGFGDVGVFSFYPGKNLGAYGDGGAIVTNDDVLARKCKMIANHGRTAKYNHEFEGRNSRLDGLQAAILSVKLKHLDEWSARRNKVAEQYLKGLVEIKYLVLPRVSSEVYHVYHLFVVRTERRDELSAYLSKQGIQTGIHYPVSLPKLAAYEYLKQADECFVANRHDSQLLSLPMGEHLEVNQIAYIIQNIEQYFSKSAISHT